MTDPFILLRPETSKSSCHVAGRPNRALELCKTGGFGLFLPRWPTYKRECAGIQRFPDGF